MRRGLNIAAAAGHSEVADVQERAMGLREQ